MNNLIDKKDVQMTDVLVDNLSILQAHIALTSPSQVELKNIATFAEAIVLYERIIYDPLLPDVPHFKKVQEVTKNLPSEIIYALDIPYAKKVYLFKNLGTILPELGFSWEYFLTNFPNWGIEIPGEEDNESGEYWGDEEGVWERISKLERFINTNPPPKEQTGWDWLFYFRASSALPKHFYYFALSSYIGVPYVPNYERCEIIKAASVAVNNPDFVKSFLDEKGWFRYKDQQTIQSSVLNYFEKTVIKGLDDQISEILPSYAVKFRLPPLASHIIEYSGKKKCSIFEAALEIRYSSQAKAFRKWCNEIQQAHFHSEIKEMTKLLRSFKQACDDWVKIYSDYQSKSQLTLNFFGVGVQMDIPLENPLNSAQKYFNKHLIFLRDLL